MYDILWTRHAKAESNRAGNVGVHILDPRLMKGVEDAANGHRGISLCHKLRRDPRGMFFKDATNRGRGVCIVTSPSLRCIETLIESLPLIALDRAKITILPSLIEQTSWFSDCPRSKPEIVEFIRYKVDRVHNREKPLNVDYSKLDKLQDNVDFRLKRGIFGMDSDSIQNRAKVARRELYEWADNSAR
jgi:hypothetical protein